MTLNSGRYVFGARNVCKRFFGSRDRAFWSSCRGTDSRSAEAAGRCRSFELRFKLEALLCPSQIGKKLLHGLIALGAIFAQRLHDDPVELRWYVRRETSEWRRFLLRD